MAVRLQLAETESRLQTVQAELDIAKTAAVRAALTALPAASWRVCSKWSLCGPCRQGRERQHADGLRADLEEARRARNAQADALKREAATLHAERDALSEQVARAIPSVPCTHSQAVCELCAGAAGGSTAAAGQGGARARGAEESRREV